MPTMSLAAEGRWAHMDGLAAVTQRIAQINSQLAALAPPAAVRPAAPTQQTFATALADAVTATASRGAAGWSASQAPSTASAQAGPTIGTGFAFPARLTRDGVPVELAAYGNGKIPSSALSPIGRAGHRLWAPAAEAFGQLAAAAKRDGVTIGVTDSYRSYDQQVDVARRKGLYSQGGLAAKPGTSDHGWGRSLDLDLNSPAQTWMRANAGRYGFVEDVPREPWHWTYSPPS